MVYRYLILLALLVAAISSYSYGNTSGLFVFVALGLLLESLFWFTLFPKTSKKHSIPGKQAEG